MRRKKAALLLVLSVFLCVTLTGCQLIGMLTGLVGNLMGGGGGGGLGGLLGGLAGGGGAAPQQQAAPAGFGYVAPADQNNTGTATGNGLRDKVKNETAGAVGDNNQAKNAPTKLVEPQLIEI